MSASDISRLRLLSPPPPPLPYPSTQSGKDAHHSEGLVPFYAQDGLQTSRYEEKWQTDYNYNTYCNSFIKISFGKKQLFHIQALPFSTARYIYTQHITVHHTHIYIDTPHYITPPCCHGEHICTTADSDRETQRRREVDNIGYLS